LLIYCNPFSSPLARCIAAKIAPQIHQETCHANQHRAAHDKPHGEIRIHGGIENIHEKRSPRGLDSSASLKPRLRHCERARRPWNRLDDDGVDQRRDVQRPEHRAMPGYVQPSSTHAHQSRCTNKTTSARARAVEMARVLRFADDRFSIVHPSLGLG
jgi:hypothetical protein